MRTIMDSAPQTANGGSAVAGKPTTRRTSGGRDRLVELRPDELPLLRDLYRRDWPRNISGFSVVDTCVRWSTGAFALYSLNGDWSDGTFVCVHRCTWIFVDTLNASTERLATAMQLLDWERGFRVAYFMDRHLGAYLAVEARLQLLVEREDCFLMFHMRREDALQLDTTCPDEFVLRPLQVQHARLVNEAWPNRHEGSLAWIEHIVERNPSVGLYRRDSGELVGWTLKYENGPIGSIYVRDAYKRRGLGSVLLNAMARVFAERGLDAFAFVKPRNLASRRLFAKAGFRQMAEPIWWMHTRPDVSESSKL